MTERPPSARPSATRPTTSRGPAVGRPPSAAGGRTGAVTGRPGSSMGGGAGGGGGGPMAGRPPSAMGGGGGNVANARPSTGAMRGGRQTAAAPRTAARPGSRLGTGAIGGGVPNVTHRPVTQQGLAGVRPMSSRGSSRQVQDKSYYMGLIRAKITELNAETSRLRKDTDHYDKERENFMIYEKQAEDLARDIKELQGQLADYNTLIDKLNTNADIQEMQDDVAHLKAQNDVDMNAIDQLFSDRRKKEDEVKQFESDLEREKAEAASVMSDMDGGLRDKYAKLKEENEQLLEDLRLKQEELQELTKKRDDLEDELAVNPLKREAMALYQRLTESEAKRDSILAELNAEGTPEEQRLRLLEKVKKDNEEIISMERQSTEVRERIEQIHEEMRELEDEMENEQSEKNQKYRELRQKEQQMDEFLSTYDQSSTQDVTRIETYQKNIATLLQGISKVIIQQQTATDLESGTGTDAGSVVQDDPTLEYQRIQVELNRLDEVEQKAAEELVTLKEKLEKMQSESETYGNLDELKRLADEKRNVYTEEKSSLADKVGESKSKARELQSEVEHLQSELGDNEFYAQIRNLEQRLQLVEQNNFVLREAVDARQAETNIQPVAEAVYALMGDYNQLVIQSLSKGSGPRQG